MLTRWEPFMDGYNHHTPVSCNQLSGIQSNSVGGKRRKTTKKTKRHNKKLSSKIHSKKRSSKRHSKKRSTRRR